VSVCLKTTSEVLAEPGVKLVDKTEALSCYSCNLLCMV